MLLQGDSDALGVGAGHSEGVGEKRCELRAAKSAGEENRDPEAENEAAVPQHQSRPARHGFKPSRPGTVWVVPRRDRLQEEIEELFADLWQVPRFAGTRRGFRPNVDSFHTGEPHALTVVIDLPGVDPSSL